MNNYPNLFGFAAKELTQDAIVCWFLECADQKISIGINFLKMIFYKAEVSFDETNYSFECKAEKQCCRMDVYTCIKNNENHYPIIFEDKVNTTLHNDQLKRYCEKVKEWFTSKKNNRECDTIIYVYFKTGYVFNNEKKYIEQEVIELNNTDSKIKVKEVILELEDIIKFLENNETNELMKCYLDYCKQSKNKQDERARNWAKTENNDSLCYHIGQGRFWETAFDSNTKWLINFSGKTEYSVHNICHCANNTNDRAYTLCYRFEPRWERNTSSKDENDKWIPKTYLQLQLYRNNSSLDTKNEWYDIISEKVSDLINNMTNNKIILDFKSKRSRKDNYQGAEIMRITFNDENKNHPEDVAKFVKSLKDEIIKHKSEFPVIKKYELKDE